MPRFKTLPEAPRLSDVFKRFPEGVWPLCELHDIKLRGPSPLSVAERELIAAYVSGLNACSYCYGAHSTIAQVQGIETEVFEKLMDSPADAGIDGKLLPILAYVRKLTLSPARVTDGDAEAVYAAGWDEQALFDAVMVCALFNFMNRVVEGCGLQYKEMFAQQTRQRHGTGKDDPEVYRNYARSAGISG